MKLVFSDDGKSLISAAEKDSTVRVWDLQKDTPESTHALEHPVIQNDTIVLSRSSNLLAVPLPSKHLRVWNLNKPDPDYIDYPTPDVVWKAEFSQDSRWLAISCWGEGARIRIWNVEDGQDPELPNVLGQDGAWSFAFSRNADGLYTLGHTSGIKFWDLRSLGEPTYEPLLLKHLKGNDGKLTSDGASLILTEGSKARLCDMRPEKQSEFAPITLTGFMDNVSIQANSMDGRWLVLNSYDGRPRLFDLANIHVARSPILYSGMQVKLDPSGRFLSFKSQSFQHARGWKTALSR